MWLNKSQYFYRMNILVTGTNGLVGQHVVKQLLAKRNTIIATGIGNSQLTI